MLTLACGPYLDLQSPRFWVPLVVFIVLKPLAYYAFIQAFRYRVSRPIPMTVRQAVRLTLVRAGLGIALTAIGALMVMAFRNEGALAWSWVWLYGSRLVAWGIVGWWGAGLRGRRLVGWIVSGTMVNAAFDLAMVVGWIEGWREHLLIVLGIGTFIAVLHAVGRRDSLKARFALDMRCAACEYSLVGNLSGRCPECGTQVT